MVGRFRYDYNISEENVSAQSVGTLLTHSLNFHKYDPSVFVSDSSLEIGF